MSRPVQILAPRWAPLTGALTPPAAPCDALVVSSDAPPLDAEALVLDLAARARDARRLVVIGPPGPTHEALRAFAASVAAERQGGSALSIELDPADDAGRALAERLARDPESSGELRWADGRLWRREWAELPPPRQAPPRPRVALVTGGLGGVGRIVAEHLRRGGARVTLVGRSPADEAARAWLSRAPGLRYVTADVCAPEGAQAAIDAAGEGLELVIHAAGVKIDGPINSLSPAELASCLAVKVRGAWNLCRATEASGARVVLFGSLAGVNGNPGQAAYAAGNAWMEGLAAQLGGARVQTVAWTFWEEGGMALPEAGRAAMARAGLRGLRAAEGAQALEDSMASGQPRLAVIARDERTLEARPAPKDPSALEPALAAALASVLKLGDRRVDPEAELSDYGLDSIGLTQLAAAISERLPGVVIGASIFVEHSTIRALARHLASASGPPAPIPAPSPAPSPAPKPTPTLGAALRGWLAELPAAPPPPAPRPPPTAPLNDDAALAAAPPTGAAPIAIIGYAARLPGPPSLRALHAALCAGGQWIVRAPAARWDWREWEGDPDEGDNHTDCHLGGFLEEIDRFDAEHFYISPREAALMDPQQRLLLTLSWEALERAGYDPRSLKGARVATCVGAGRNEYGALLAARRAQEAHSNTGNTPALLSNRLSWFYGWTGPSQTLDVGCAGSMVAVAEAVATLRRGDATLALAGGVSLIAAPHGLITNRRMGLLTASGRVRSYDMSADGHVFGEGAGLVVLKRLDRALADGDAVLGVIRGVSVNHSGRTPTLTTPSAKGQAQAIRDALTDAGLGPGDLSAILGQGTATAASDLAELGAYRAALHGRERPAPLTSLDGALGHLESASGVASLLVGLEVLRSGELPPALGFRALSPQALADGPLPVEVATRPTPLGAGAGPIRLGVHNFGYGGVNTHLVLEAPPRRPAAPATQTPTLLVLSAPTPGQLNALASALGEALREDPSLELADVAFTLRAGRRAFERRLALVVNDRDEAAARLLAHGAGAPAGLVGHVESPTGQLAAGDPHSLAAAFCRGDTLPEPPPGRRAPLPTLPLSGPGARAGAHWAAAPPAGPGAPRRDAQGWSIDRRWAASDPLLNDHRAQGVPTLPAASALSLLATLARAAEGSLCVREAVWLTPLQAPDGARVAARLSLRGEGEGAEAELRGASGALHLQARLGPVSPPSAEARWPTLDPGARRVSGEALRASMAQAGLTLGPALSAVEEVLVDGETAIGRLRAPAGAAGLDLETALLDGAFQVASALLSTPSLPVAIHELWRADGLAGATTARARRRPDAGRMSRVSVELLNDAGEALLTVGQLSLLPLRADPAPARPALPAAPTTPAPAPLPHAESAASAEATVRAVLAQVLGVDPAALSSARPLAQLGLDSILAVEAAQALSARFGPLPATLLFELETLDAITRRLAGAAPQPLAPEAPAPARPSLTARRVDPEAVAIIGMAGRYPQAPDLDALWELLSSDRSAITAPPADRWDPAELERIDPGGRTRRGGFLDGIERFDHTLFEIPHATAATMDPQVRLVLEIAWQTLCAAGYPPERLAAVQAERGVGVFVASMAAPYPAVADDPLAAAWLSHVTAWPLANRVSYTLDLRGPSVAVDAACAGGLAAVHLAAEAVRRGEASMALAAGVNLILHPSKLASLGQSGLGGAGDESLSLQGGDGYLPAEGCGAVLLRRLGDALDAGDRVLGVIRASGMGHNGRSAGLHTPSASAQARLIREVRSRAGDAGARVSAVECGATGARLGDAVELAALKSAYADRPEGGVAVSTVKAQLGHAEGASGLAQLHRALLQLQHRQLLPTRGAERLDPGLGLEGSALAPVPTRRPWGDHDEDPLVIAVNSAGAGGANAHLLVESAAPEPPRPAPSAGPRLLLLSARTPGALVETAARLARWTRRTRPRLDDLQRTLITAAPRQAQRLAVIADSAEELAAHLEAFAEAPDAPRPRVWVGRAGPGLAEALSGDLGEAVAAALPSAADPRAATLWAHGVELPWEKLTPPESRLLDAPPYVFERTRCWLHDGPLLCPPRGGAPRPEQAPVAPAAVPVPAAVPAALPASGPPPSPAREALQAALTALLGPDAAADGARPLRQLGLDSLLALQLSNRVERDTGLRLDPSALLDDPTLDGLVAHLEGRLARPAPRPEPREGTPREADEPLPLSVNQGWHWSLHSLLPDQPGLLTIPVALRLTGPLAMGALRAALQATVDRHPALRRGFSLTADGPRQQDQTSATLPIRTLDLRHLGAVEAQAAAQAALAADQAPFDLQAPPLLRATVIQLADQEHLLGLTAHHLAVDLWSVGLLIREVAERYTALVEGRPPRLTPAEGGLRELLAWEARTWTPETIRARAEALLDGLPPLLEPLDLGGGDPSEARASVIRGSLPRAALLSGVSRGEHTVFERLFVALALRLAAQTEATDLLIGVPVLGRELPEAEGALGFYADVVAVHVRVDPSHSQARVVSEAVASLRAALAWRLPFPEALRALRGRQLDRARPPVSVCVTFSAQADAPRLGELQVRLADSGRADLVFDLFLTAIDGAESIELVLEYQPARVSHEVARRLVGDLERVLASVSQAPERPVSALSPMLGLPRRPRVRVMGTFSLDGLAEAMTLWRAPLQLDLRVELAGYQQTFQELLQPDSGLARLEGGLGVVLLRLWDGRADPRRLAAELAAAVESALPRLKSPLLLARCPDPLDADASFRHAADAAWASLRSALGERVQWLTPEALFSALPPGLWDDPVADHEANVPYTTDGVLALGAALVRRLASQVTPPYKVLAVDCDNTLWVGVVGEQGATGVEVDAPRARLQRLLVSAVEAGALIVLLTKNNEEDVREALTRHPEMILRLPHVTRVAASWRPKSETLREVLADLNLGLGDVLYLDDNPMEIAEVEATLPQVSAVRVPVEPELLDKLLDKLWPLDPRRGTDADRERTAQYRVVAERAAFQRAHSSYRDFLAALDLEVSLSPVQEADLARVSQLTLRTTQFNATSRRRSEADLRAWLGEPGRAGRVVRAKDRFGDYGLVGVLLVEALDGVLWIDTLLMSCRVLGRGIEHQTLAEAGRIASALGLARVGLRFAPTARNQPMRDLLERALGPFGRDEPGARVYLAERDVVSAVRDEAQDAAPSPVEESAAAALTPSGRAAALRQILALSEPEALRAAWARRRPAPVGERPPGTPPQSDSERRLAAIWREVLSVEPYREDDFFALGGDSLAATRLISRVAEQLWDGALRLDGVFAAPTLAAMAAALDAALLRRVEEIATLDEDALNRAYEALTGGGDVTQVLDL